MVHEDIEHAIRMEVLAIEIDDDKPRRVLHLGPDRANNFLEIVTLEFDDGRSMAIHAMKMRPKYAHLLLEHFGGDEE